MSPTRSILRPLVAALLGLAALASAPAQADTTLLNVSYDVSRELYKDVNPAFIAKWQKAGGDKLTVNQSHGGSSKQVQSVVAGLEADVVTMNQAPDIEALVKNGLVSPTWRKAFPHEAAPYTTTTIFLVRKGNPKGIKDWSDLTRAGLQVIVPNPKTSGNGRYTYLAAWGYALQKTGSEAGARDFVSKLFANVPVLDGGGRGATTTFTQRDIGDVLITFENEATLIDQEVGGDKFDVVYPSLSIEAAAPVAVVNKVVDKRGTRKAAEAYLNFLFAPEGQEIIARHHFRPRDPAILKKYASRFPAVKTFTVEEKLGGWDAVQKTHFADGGVYDQIVVKR
ncbi:MAG: sulfate ABC transporter substrate-binding protein [Zoogloea sp.]|uniref:sulfate ABC transporter substrate-binding protein n=1 Tax=Zoogloea sp. TaxID=49181 RepID=UPI001ACF1CEF|nr:sulfate ABC transporter substrate-binding protein [Zoogloea sp.]MBN8282742.1 sulfate ABC transporter substrate-binding protein [Zoogloea sp.]MBN9697754.1 sulfate ABC transporter substrate-binding protein [Zoogloea sp.]MCA0187127.1 sulfate ABC transporter substrate-binding protein [Pseudomonadota bacterium]